MRTMDVFKNFLNSQILVQMIFSSRAPIVKVTRDNERLIIGHMRLNSFD